MYIFTMLLADLVWVKVKLVCEAVAVTSSDTSLTKYEVASTLPSAFKNCDDVPPDLTIVLPVIVPLEVSEVKVPTEVMAG